MRRFLKKFCSGPFFRSLLFSVFYWSFLALVHFFCPDLNSDFVLFDGASTPFYFLFGASLISWVTLLCGVLCLLFDYIHFRLHAKKACQPLEFDVPICTYVDDATYHRLFVMCGQTGIPFEKFCQLVLGCFDPMKLDTIIKAYDQEV